MKILETRKNSRFYLCTLSEIDPRFPKYPRIPVVRCLGYVPEPTASRRDAEDTENGFGR